MSKLLSTMDPISQATHSVLVSQGTFSQRLKMTKCLTERRRGSSFLWPSSYINLLSPELNFRYILFNLSHSKIEKLLQNNFLVGIIKVLPIADSIYQDQRRCCTEFHFSAVIPFK